MTYRGPTLPPTTPSRLRIAVALLLIVSSLGAVAATPASAAGWAVKPATTTGFGADRKDYGYTVSPGGRLQDGIQVVNPGATTVHVALGAAEGVTTPQGRLSLVRRGAKSKDVASWVHLEQNDVTVLPGTSVTVPFVITPPKDAAAGDHVGGIVTATAAGAEAAGPGLPVRLRVSGALKPSLAAEGVRVRYTGTASPSGTGDATVTYTIRNSGNAILTARQAVSASGPLAAWERRAARVPDVPPLLPGATWKVSVPLHDVAPAFRLRATVKVVPLLTDSAGSIAPLATIEATGGGWAIPWSLLLVVVVLVVLGGLATVGLRRRRRVAVA
jgi:hypothetical protein